MDIKKNICEVTTKLPTFLETLLQENFPIKLVYHQKHEMMERTCYTLQEGDENNDEMSVSELDLTGTPLITDLGGDDSLCIDLVPVIPPSWSPEETKYYPISFEKARSYINFAINEDRNVLNKPIFCLCDGNDVQSTVTLGVAMDRNTLTRIMVYVLPCHYENHEITTVEYMQKEHAADIGKITSDVKTDFSIKKRYYLWGHNLKNSVSFENVEHNGSIALELDTNSSKNIVNSKMILQIIKGHCASPLKSFWDDLNLIQSHINLLSNSKELTGASVISNNSLNYEEISLLVCNLLTEKLFYIKKTMKEHFDLKNLRQEDVLDRLWHTLKFCRNLSDLRDSLHLFFEQIIEVEAKIQISNNNMSIVAEIVKNIMDGTIVISQLSFVQCLELFVDLGLEKLKEDYLMILNHFCMSAKENVAKKWGNLCFENTSAIQIFSKKSRISISSKSSINDLSKSRIKLSYLENLHKAVDLLFIYKENVNMNENTMDQLCEAVCNQFIFIDHNMETFCDINKQRLCEFTFNIFPVDNSIIETISPVTWSVKITSVTELSEVTTIFHFSEFPIFPPTLFDNYVKSFHNSDIRSLYITKLLKYYGIC